LALQTSMEVVASDSEVWQILELSTERTKDCILAQSLEEVLEQEQRAKVLTQIIHEKVLQLSAPTQSEAWELFYKLVPILE